MARRLGLLFLAAPLVHANHERSARNLYERFTEFIFKFTRHYRWTARVQQLVTTPIENLGNVVEAGFQGTIHGMDFKKLFTEVQPGETVLWLDIFDPRTADFATELDAALTRGVNVKMLIQEPGTRHARNRASELGEPLPHFDATQRQFILAMHQLVIAPRPSAHGKLQMRTYNDLPSVPMYIIVSKSGETRYGYTGFFLSTPTDHSHSVHLKWTNCGKEPSIDLFAKYFNFKWESFAETDFRLARGDFAA